VFMLIPVRRFVWCGVITSFLPSAPLLSRGCTLPTDPCPPGVPTGRAHGDIS
jgi:hypothetical protein